MGMRFARRPSRLVMVGLLALGAVACRPDLPGRGCKSADDCFTQEVCTDGTCATRAASGGAGGSGGSVTGGTGGSVTGGTGGSAPGGTGGSAAGGSGGSGGVPAPAPDVGAPLDAGAPDATP